MSRRPRRPLSDQDLTRLGLAALAVALARSLDALLPGVLQRFEADLETVFHQLNEWPGEPQKAQDLLMWAKELIHDEWKGAL